MARMSGSGALIPRRALFGNPQRRSLRVSPDGKWISLVAPHDGVLNIWLAPAADIASMQPLTRERGHGVQACRWTSDSAHLCFMKDQDGDENYHLFVLPLDGGEAIDMTPLNGVAVRIIAGSRRRPTKLLVGLNDRDPRWHDVYLLDLTDGTRELVLRNDRFVTFQADRDLVLRVAVSPTPDGGLDYMVPDHDGGWRCLVRVQEEDALATGIAGLGPDGSNLAYFIDSRGRDRAAAVAIDLTTGAAKELAADPDAEVVGIMIDPIERGLQAVRTMHLRADWRVMDPRVEPDFVRLAALATGEFQILSRTADDRQWIVAHTGDKQPGVYHLYDRQAGIARHLLDIRPELADAAFRPMQALTIAARDGLALPAYLTQPGVENAGDPTAMVLLVHGGPWSRDSWGFNPWHQWLADRGYAALSVSYRGSTGFGKAFTNAGDREWGGRMQDDLLDAVDWAIGAGVADPARIAIMGASYGGYATLLGLTATPTTFACGIDVFGPSDLEALIANIPPYWQPLIALWHRRVGDISTEEGRRFLRARSPLHQADRICRPLLIAHGNNDPRLNVAASEAIVAASQRNDHPVMFLRYPDEGHGLVRHENRLSFHAVAEAFLARYLGGRCEPFGSDLQGSSMLVEVGADLLDGLAGASLGEKM
jgi:dipeptidyl aminopeptidase/acylaminoacyl peptidase